MTGPATQNIELRALATFDGTLRVRAFIPSPGTGEWATDPGEWGSVVELKGADADAQLDVLESGLKEARRVQQCLRDGRMPWEKSPEEPQPDTQALADAVYRAASSLDEAINAAWDADLEVQLEVFCCQGRHYPDVTVRAIIGPSEDVIAEAEAALEAES
jgi:hypothetical protein